MICFHCKFFRTIRSLQVNERNQLASIPGALKVQNREIDCFLPFQNLCGLFLFKTVEKLDMQKLAVKTNCNHFRWRSEANGRSTKFALTGQNKTNQKS